MREAVCNGAHDVLEEGALARLDVDIGRHAGRGAEVADFAADILLIERDADNEGLRSGNAWNMWRARRLRHGVGRDVDDLSGHDWHQTLVQRRETHQRLLR